MCARESWRLPLTGAEDKESRGKPRRAMLSSTERRGGLLPPALPWAQLTLSRLLISFPLPRPQLFPTTLLEQLLAGERALEPPLLPRGCDRSWMELSEGPGVGDRGEGPGVMKVRGAERDFPQTTIDAWGPWAPLLNGHLCQKEGQTISPKCCIWDHCVTHDWWFNISLGQYFSSGHMLCWGVALAESSWESHKQLLRWHFNGLFLLYLLTFSFSPKTDDNHISPKYMKKKSARDPGAGRS